MEYSKGFIHNVLLSISVSMIPIFNVSADTSDKPVINKRAECAIIKEYMMSETLLRRGEKLMRDGNYVEAANVFDAGLRTLGNLYVSPDLIDDSGQKLILAEWVQKKGAYKDSANIKRGTLSSRMEAFMQRPTCSK